MPSQNRLINPKTIFLIDAIGAAISACIIALVLIPNSASIGIPNSLLILLAGEAFCLAWYSTTSHFMSRSNWRLFLKILVYLNSAYIVFTIVILALNYKTLTGWGIAYFVGELLIIASLANVEWRLARSMP